MWPLSRRVRIVAVAALVLGTTIGIFTMRASPRKDVMHSVSIQLPGSPDQVRGMKMIVFNGRGSGDLPEPQVLTIHTADGASMTMIGRSSSVTMSRGRVNAVYVRRPLKPVRFLDAKADLLNTLTQLGIEPDMLMRNQISSWTEDVPGNGDVPEVMPYDYKTGINAQFHGLVLSIRVSPDPNHGWYYLLIFSALTPDVIPGISPATQPTTMPAGKIQEISAKLLGGAADVLGGDVHIPTVGMGEADLLQPQDITLTLPDDHRISIDARSSNILFFDGIAHGVFIRRPMKAVSFKEAKGDMMKTLATLHIEPDGITRSTMSDWPEDVQDNRRPSPSLGVYQAGFAKSIHGATLTLRLCPDSGGGWYYFIIFSVGLGGS